MIRRCKMAQSTGTESGEKGGGTEDAARRFFSRRVNSSRVMKGMRGRARKQPEILSTRPDEVRRTDTQVLGSHGQMLGSHLPQDSAQRIIRLNGTVIRPHMTLTALPIHMVASVHERPGVVSHGVSLPGRLQRCAACAQPENNAARCPIARASPSRRSYGLSSKCGSQKQSTRVSKNTRCSGCQRAGGTACRRLSARNSCRGPWPVRSHSSLHSWTEEIATMT